MTIQFNTDNNIKGSDELRAYFSTSISEALSRFGHHITKVEGSSGKELIYSF